MRYGPGDIGPPSDPAARPITREHEERLRRAIRHLIQCARSEDGRADVEHVFTLLAYLRPDLQAIIEDETASTLAELIGTV